uniref:Uncharacterized protein n=1 Tax=Panagrolaimus superbus TaxID=310955 RepID=A0A914YWV2_9BILA
MKINSTNLNSIRNADAVLTLTIKCSQKSEQVANPEARLFSRLRNLERLAIDRCKMEKIPPELFYGMLKLYNLIVKNADLKDIPANAFQYQSNLMSLDLSGNKLQSEPHALFSLKKLLQLDLSKNSINFVSNILQSSTTIKVLSLSNNELETLDFRRLPKSLTDLNLSNNKISTIYAYPESVMNLSRLDLSRNNLGFIAAKGAMNELPNSLNILDLSDNKIREIQENTFQKMTKLSMLDLRNNSINEITETALEVKIRYRYQLYMGGNPLKCACDNYWILHPKSKSSPIIADISNVTCYHVLDDSRKMTLLDAELMSGFLCKYDSNCLDGCECCQQRHEKKCNCYHACPAGCGCWGSAGAHATKVYVKYNV